MYPISINPFMNRNIFDNYVESVSILGQISKCNYLTTLSQLGVRSSPCLDWSQMRIQDFIGNDIDISCRLTILSCLIGNLTDEQFELEYESALNKCILKKDELNAIRLDYSNIDDYVNFVDLAYYILKHPKRRDKLLTKNINLLSSIAHGGYDLIYFFADISHSDCEQECEDVIKNRNLCYEILDDILRKEKEIVNNGSGTESI